MNHNEYQTWEYMMTTATVLKHTKFQPLEVVDAQTLDEAVDNLLKKGWTRFTYPTLSRRFESLVATFIGMTEDANRDQYLVKHPREFDEDEPGLGLMYQTKGQIKKKPRKDEIAEGRLRYDESKFKFHFNDRLLGYLGQVPGLIEKHGDFFLHAARMHSEAKVLGLEVADHLDKRMPGYNFADRMIRAEGIALLRFLRYLCDGKSPGIATRHRDRDFLTIHIRSDRGGLWLADNNNVIVPDAQETRPNSVLIFFGRKAWEITRGKLKGIPHGVTDILFNDLIGRLPRHTAVEFLHTEADADDLIWADDHMSDLNFPPHVDTHGLT